MSSLGLGSIMCAIRFIEKGEVLGCHDVMMFSNNVNGWVGCVCVCVVWCVVRWDVCVRVWGGDVCGGGGGVCVWGDVCGGGGNRVP